MLQFLHSYGATDLVNLCTHVLVPELVLLAQGEVLRRAHEGVARVLTQEVAVIFVTEREEHCFFE